MSHKTTNHKTKTDYLTRAVQLHVMRDGTLTTHPVKGLPTTGHTGDWRDIAIDALLDEKLDTASRVIQESRREPMIHEREQELYTLPIFSVNTIDEAKSIQVRFCRLMYGTHPLLDKDERWYVISSWDEETESLSELYRMQVQFALHYQAMQTVNLPYAKTVKRRKAAVKRRKAAK